MASSELRVLHVLPTLDPTNGGLVTYWQAAQSALMQSGITLEARAPGLSGFHETAGTTPGPAERPNALAGLELWGWLRAHVKEYKAVHIHGVFSWPLALGARAARSSRIPYMVSTHGHLYPWSLSQKPWRKTVYLAASARALLRGAHRVVATCDREARILQAFDPKLRIAVVRPGVPSAETGCPSEPRTGQPAAIRLVFVNRIAPQKGLPVLLRAMANLLSRGISVELDLVGDGDATYKAQMLSLQNTLGVRNAVNWRGFLTGSAKQKALLRADLFVLPSNMENFSFATAEALSAAVPVVVSDSVALADEVRKYECGAVVPTGDDVRLADAISSYLDPALRTRHAHNALQCAKDVFSLQAMGASLRDLYATVTMESHG